MHRKKSGLQAEFLNELQKIAAGKTRLKIPVLQIEEGTHGLMCSGGTIFPEGLSRGAQGDDVSAPDKLAAALCHYPGQSQPVSGLERGAMQISERTLREVFLPPWVTGIKQCGALGVMATYPAIEGVAVHSSQRILIDILREELGFDGVVLSEGRGISTIIDEHMAETQKEAVQIAVNSGVDVGISLEDVYLTPLIESVREGSVSKDAIDRAVSHILKLKFRLGLFENPYVDPERASIMLKDAMCWEPVPMK